MQDERELGATERGFLLYELLSERPRTTEEVQGLLGYKSYSGAASLLSRIRVKLARDDKGYWYITHDA